MHALNLTTAEVLWWATRSQTNISDKKMFEARVFRIQKLRGALFAWGSAGSVSGVHIFCGFAMAAD